MRRTKKPLSLALALIMIIGAMFGIAVITNANDEPDNGVNLSVKENIVSHYHIDADYYRSKGCDSYRYSYNGTNDIEKYTEVTSDDIALGSGSEVVIDTYQAAAQIAEPVTIEIFGDAVSYTVTFSAKDYCDRIINTSAEELGLDNVGTLKKLSKSILAYAKAAQDAFDYAGKTVNGAIIENGYYDELGIEDATYDTTIEKSAGSNVSFRSASFICTSSAKMRFYLQVADLDDFIDYGDPVSDIPEGSSVSKGYVKNGTTPTYFIQINDIKPTDFDYPIQISYAGASIKMSVLNYAGAVINSAAMGAKDKTLAKSLIVYNDKAEAYFDEHTMVEFLAVAPNCTTEGSIAYFKCTDCGRLFGTADGKNLLSAEEIVVPATGHTEVIDAAVPATATTTGLTEGKHCSVCNTVLVAQEVVPVFPKAEVTDITNDPENTENLDVAKKFEQNYDDETYYDDFKADFIVTVDNDLADGEGELWGKFGSYDWTKMAGSGVRAGVEYYLLRDVYEWNLTYKDVRDVIGTFYCGIKGDAAQATNVNVKLVVYEDGAADYILINEFDYTIPAHDYAAAVTAPTCTEQGYTTYTCANCGDSYVADYVAATGHTPAAAVQENVVSATCSAEGSYDEVVKCSVCGAEISREAKSIEKLAHTVVIDAEVPATSSSTGLTEGSHCSVCGEIIVAQQIIPVLDELPTAVLTDITNSEENTIDLGVAKKFEANNDGILYNDYKADFIVTVDKDLADGEGELWGKFGSYDWTKMAGSGVQAGVEYYLLRDVYEWDLTYEDVCDVIGTFYCGIKGEAEEATTVTVKLVVYEAGSTEYDVINQFSYIIPAHQYTAVVTAPTCEQAGYTTYSCVNCNKSYTADEVAALGHDITWTVTTAAVAPTCEAAGATAIETASCSRCDFSDTRGGETVNALGHDITDTVTAPTCEEAGYTTHTCSRCDYNVVDTPVTALGHDFGAWTVTTAAVAPTCEEAGSTAVETRECSRCDASENRGGETVNALGHDITDTVTAPTCEEAGYTTHTCSRCDYNVVDTPVAALGHDFGAWTVTTAAVAPTCEEAGSTAVETRECSRCDASENRGGETVNALGHDITDTVTAPTCEEAGYTTHTCSRCDYNVVDTPVEALGHDITWTVTTAAVAPTCEAAGATAIETASCSRCDYSDVRGGEVVNALGHEFVATVTAPTCEAAGYTTYTCSRCPETYTADFVDALGHDITDTVTAPTCEEAGYTTHTCSRCDYNVVDTPVEALGHDITWTVTTAAVAPTCEAAGATAIETASCSRCDFSDTRGGEVVNALGHDITDTVTAPTCEEAGYTTHTCSRCDYNVVDTPVTALGHDLGEWAETTAAVAPTCEATGKTAIETRECSRCEYSETRGGETVNALGHDITDTVTAPTCEAAGYTTHTCSRCDYNVVDTPVEALGHDITWTVTTAAVAPTCTTAGATAIETASCSRCDYSDTRGGEEVPATGHTYTAVETTPTCTEQGYTTYTCECGDSYVDDYVPATGHTEVIDAAVAATCTETGLTEGKHCSVCNEVLVAQTVVPATGHTEVTDAAVAATCTETGLTEGKHCSVCNEVLVAQTVVPATGHTEVTDAAVAPTCTETGLTEGKHCSVCNEVLVAQTVVNALGHDITWTVTTAAVAPTCTEAGATAIETASCSRCDYSDVRGGDVVPATGHTVVVDAAVAATYSSTGLTEGSHCSVCNEVLVAQQVVPAIVYTVSYNTNGNGQTIANATTNNQGRVTLPTVDSRTGYDFDGWYDAQTGGNKVGDQGASVEPGSSRTYYAHWNAHKHQIKAATLRSKLDFYIYDEDGNGANNTYLGTATSSGGSWNDNVVISNDVPYGAEILMVVTLDNNTSPRKLYWNDNTNSNTSQNGCYYNNPTMSGTPGDEAQSGNYYFRMGDSDIKITSRQGNDPCVAEGSLVTMADGTQKAIEDVKPGDMVMTWSMWTGTYEAQPVAILWDHGTEEQDVMNLTFSDGTVIRMFDGHGFFDVDENNYVYLTQSNVNKYIGDEFVKFDADGAIQTITLESCEVTTEVVGSYSIQTAFNENFVVENMLSMTAETFEGRFEYFEIGEGMKYDEAKMQADIEKYGLYTYEEWSDYFTAEEFYAFNGQYFKVLMGKGIMTEEELFWIISYAQESTN